MCFQDLGRPRSNSNSSRLGDEAVKVHTVFSVEFGTFVTLHSREERSKAFKQLDRYSLNS